MINLAQELGVQSYCYRGFKDNRTFIAKVKETGLSAVEICGVHVDFNDQAKFAEIVKLYQDSGIAIRSIGVQGFNNDAVKERKYFEFCKLAGARHMSVNFTPECMMDGFHAAEKLADEYDLLLGIHLHGGAHWLGNSAILRYITKRTSRRIGLCLDTAWALDARENPVKMVEEFADRVHLLHLKDFVFDRARKPEDVVVGTGNLDLKALYAALKKVDFKGVPLLEYEGDVANPVPALRECVAAVRKQMAG